jgi:pimeloyl-ACP methyl ester carboxylesterase
MDSPEAKMSRSQTVQKWISILSVSRILRWSLILVSGWWLLSNAHNDLEFNQLANKYSSLDSRFVEVDGLMAHCRITGKGPPIMLLHDAQSSLHTWSGWADALSDKYQVISVDLPGFGLTGPHPLGSYSAFMYVGFLDSLAQKLGLNKFHLAGNGLGAQIAWQYAAERPSRIDKLILLSPAGFEKKSSSWVAFLARAPVVNRIIWKITPRSFINIYLEEVYADDALVTDSLIDRHFELMLRSGNRKAFTDRASVRDNRPPVADLIKQITAPTLILWGAEDTRISPEYAYEFHQRIKTSDLRIYPNTGHWPQEENPLKTAEDVRAFLEGRF